MQHYVAGQVSLMPAFTALIAPTINSYKRMVRAPGRRPWRPGGGEPDHRAARHPWVAGLDAGRVPVRGRRHEPLRRHGGVGRQRALRHRARAPAACRNARQRLRREGPALPATLREATAWLAESKEARELLGPRSWITTSGLATGVPAVRERGDAVGARALFRDHLRGAHGQRDELPHPDRLWKGRDRGTAGRVEARGSVAATAGDRQGYPSGGLLRFVTPLLDQAG